MKHKLSILFVAFVLVLSCRSDDSDDVQQIDQVLNIYIKNATGQDLLNSKLQDSYTSVALLDLLAETDLKSISGSSLKQNADSLTYLDYSAGAIRLLQDSISSSNKTYYSEFVIRLTKTVDKQSVVDDDTIKVTYNWSPSLFQVSKLWYNNELKFTKVQGQPNVVTIVK